MRYNKKGKMYAYYDFTFFLVEKQRNACLFAKYEIL